MNNTLSQVIFGIGIVLAIAAVAAIFINSFASNNSSLVTNQVSSSSKSSSNNNTTDSGPASPGQSSNSSDTSSTSITINQGSAAQQVSQYYSPNPSHVEHDSKVTWTNNDITMHTATALDGSFDTGLIQPGSSASIETSNTGAIAYKCTLHPWMTGTIDVSSSGSNNGTSSASQASAPPPSPLPSSSNPVTNNNSALSNQQENALPKLNDTNLNVEPVVSGLNEPTTMEFLGPNDFLVLQKSGTVIRVTDGVISSKPLLNVTVPTGITQGMLGIEMVNGTSPDTRTVFLYYTEGVRNTTGQQNQTGEEIQTVGNKVYRYELINGTLTNPQLLLSLPAKQGYMDNGGYLRIGPDGHLYMTVGAITADSVSAVQTLTQNFVNGTPVDGRAGILRMTLDGDPVLNGTGHGLLGNTFPLNLYYGYGLKDSFGIDFDPITGNLWDAEPGRFISDEINLIRAGFNGGFETIQGQSVYVPAAPTGLVNFNGTGKYSDPEFVWTEKIVPVGLKFLNSDKLGVKYQNDLFVGSFLNGNIYHFDLTEDRIQLVVPQSFINNQMATWNSTGSDDITFGSGFGGISSMHVGPDGLLYVISFSNGVIYKISAT